MAVQRRGRWTRRQANRQPRLRLCPASLAALTRSVLVMCFPRFLHVHHLIVSLLQVPCLQPQPVIPWPDPKGVSVHTTSHGQRCCVTLVGLLSLHALDCRKPRPMAWWPLVSLGRSSLSSSSWSSSTPSKGSCSHGGTHTRVYEHAHVRAHSRHLSHTHTHTHTHSLTHTHTHTHTQEKGAGPAEIDVGISGE